MSDRPSDLQIARDWFSIADVREKIRSLPRALELALSENRADGGTNAVRSGPISIARDVTVVSKSQLPPKPGLSRGEGQARLLHDLGSIELQAMELGLRTLVEFPDAPVDFRKELADVTMGEARHLGLCLEGLNALDFDWGYWDVHVALLDTVSHQDTLLDRILIVHRYLEGSGLDAGDSILKRLNGVRAEIARPVVQMILREEVDHVMFGSRWYRKICEQELIDPARDFESRLRKVVEMAPRREHIADELRLRAGFTLGEIEALRRHTPFHQDGEKRAAKTRDRFTTALLK